MQVKNHRLIVYRHGYHADQLETLANVAVLVAPADEVLVEPVHGQKVFPVKRKVGAEDARPSQFRR